jgi:hypothetical protein
MNPAPHFWLKAVLVPAGEAPDIAPLWWRLLRSRLPGAPAFGHLVSRIGGERLLCSYVGLGVWRGVQSSEINYSRTSISGRGNSRRQAPRYRIIPLNVEHFACETS